MGGPKDLFKIRLIMMVGAMGKMRLTKQSVVDKDPKDFCRVTEMVVAVAMGKMKLEKRWCGVSKVSEDLCS